MENKESEASEADWPSPLRERRRKRIEETAQIFMTAMMPKKAQEFQVKDDIRKMLRRSFETAELFVDEFDRWIADKERP